MTSNIAECVMAECVMAECVMAECVMAEYVITESVLVKEETVEMLYTQVPIECTREIIRDTLIKTNNNINKALELLWNIPEPVPKQFKFLDDVREIADACDAAMEERDMKNKYFTNVNKT